MLIAALLTVPAACSGSSSEAVPDDATGSPTTAAAEPAVVTLSLADGAADVPPTTPLEVTVTGGELGDVTVADATGPQLTGSLEPRPNDSSTAVWTPEGELEYGTSYTGTATAANAADAEKSTPPRPSPR